MTGIIFLTELTSNTATTATLVPDPRRARAGARHRAPAADRAGDARGELRLHAAGGDAAERDRLRLRAASRIPQMSRAGFWLNWIGIVLITALAYDPGAAARGLRRRPRPLVRNDPRSRAAPPRVGDSDMMAPPVGKTANQEGVHPMLRLTPTPPSRSASSPPSPWRSRRRRRRTTSPATASTSVPTGSTG